MEIRIQTVHFAAKDELLALVEKKVRKLEQYYDRITNVIVFLKAERDEHKTGKTVEIEAHIPGTTLFATHHSEKFEASADQAVEAMRKQLMKHKEKVYQRH